MCAFYGFPGSTWLRLAWCLLRPPLHLLLGLVPQRCPRHITRTSINFHVSLSVHVCVCVCAWGLGFCCKIAHTHKKLWVIIILVYDLSTFRAASLEFCLLRRTAQGELSPRCLCVCTFCVFLCCSSIALAALNFNLILLYVCVRLVK